MDHGSGTTRIDCTTVAPLLGHYLAEKLEEATRLAIRGHLQTCPACSAEARNLDPSILFMGLGQERPASESWARFDAALRSRLEAESRKPRGVFAGWDLGRLETALRMPRLAYAAPLAMLALLAGLMFVTQPGMIRGPRPHVEGIRPPNEIGAPVKDALDPRDPATGFGAARTASLRLTAAESALLPTLEQVTSPAARVYRLDVGAPASAEGPAATDSGAVYFVVDETINF